MFDEIGSMETVASWQAGKPISTFTVPRESTLPCLIAVFIMMLLGYGTARSGAVAWFGFALLVIATIVWVLVASVAACGFASFHFFCGLAWIAAFPFGRAVALDERLKNTAKGTPPKN